MESRSHPSAAARLGLPWACAGASLAERVLLAVPGAAIAAFRGARRSGWRPGPLLVALLLALPTLPAAAEVEVVTRADGTRVVRNVGEAPSRASRPAPPRRASAPRAELARLAERRAVEQGLDPRLVQAVIQVESGWDHRARSRKGAMGLMQLMPGTAVALAVDDPWDATQNLRGGTEYLAALMERFGSVELALAAYNAGPGAVERHAGLPPYAETREYVPRVLSIYRGRPVGLREVLRAVEETPWTALARARREASGAGSSRRSRSTRPPRLVRHATGRLVLTNEAVPRSGHR